MIHRPHRSDATRLANEGEVGAYSARLERLFTSWLGSGEHAAELTDRMDKEAQAAFPIAYLRGKRQVFKSAEMADDDRQAVQMLIESNAHYVRWSLETAIEARRQLARITDEDESKVLDSAFASRVRLQYGGRLWQVIEAGHLNGVRELSQMVNARLGRPALVQAFQVDAISIEDDELAAAMGITVSSLLNIASRMSLGETRVRSGTEYVTEGDDHVCDPCLGNAGEYWLPDQPPLPGEDCVGMQNCRCHLESIWEISD